MLGNFGRHLRPLRPRLNRGVSQILAEPMAWNQAPAQVTTLPNGVRVATKEMFSETTSVGIYLDAGSRSETKECAGATHMIEQLALSGTKKRSRAALESEVDSLGGSLSVSAGREQTAYEMSVCGKDAKAAVDILSDMVTNTGIGNLAKEKDGILRSLGAMEQPTRAVIDDRLHTCAFRDYSLGFSRVGPFDGIDGITEAQLQGYVNANHTAEKMVIAATGPIKHADFVNLASSALGSVKAGTPAPYGTKPYFCGAELIYRNDEMGPTAYISVGFEAVPWKSPDAVTFMVMSSIIGEYNKTRGLVPGKISGNRIINNVANKMDVGCADEFEGFTHFYKDTGVFGFYIACDEVAVEHSIGELMFGINLLSFSVTDEEVERGKRELKTKLFGGSETTAAACSILGQEMLAYGRSIPAAEMMLRIEAVDSEEVKRVAYQYCNDAEVAVTALGPLHGMPQYFDLRRASIMHRY